MKTNNWAVLAFLAVFACIAIMCESVSDPHNNEGDDDDNSDDDDDNNDDNDIDTTDGFDDDDDSNDEDETKDTNELNGCEGVDFLFVIDNSGSMGDEQQNLIASFPGFIESIEKTLELTDYHIMVVDTDGGFYGGAPAQQNCNRVLGAGHIGQNTQANCQIDGGNRYLIEGQNDLNGTFACIAGVSTMGNGNEKGMEAMVNAVGRENQSGGCNEGFIRDNAILVVTLITDEDEQCTEPREECSAGTPESWKQALVDAKGGNERAIVMLGVFGDNDETDGICEEYQPDSGDGAMPAPLLRDYMALFTDDRKQYCSVCLDSYAECFDEAVKTIDLTCDELVE